MVAHLSSNRTVCRKKESRVLIENTGAMVLRIAFMAELKIAKE
jgi:hypothetical protein